jgi:hypothetical protein
MLDSDTTDMGRDKAMREAPSPAAGGCRCRCAGGTRKSVSSAAGRCKGSETSGEMNRGWVGIRVTTWLAVGTAGLTSTSSAMGQACVIF